MVYVHLTVFSIGEIDLRKSRFTMVYALQSSWFIEGEDANQVIRVLDSMILPSGFQRSIELIEERHVANFWSPELMVQSIKSESTRVIGCDSRMLISRKGSKLNMTSNSR